VGDREIMLDRIRAARDAGASAGGPPPIPREYRRSGAHEPGTGPAVDLLVDRLVDYRAEVIACGGHELAGAIATALAGAGSVVVPGGVPAVEREACAADGRSVVVDGDPADLSPEELDGIDAVVTHARVAIADTGTIVLDASPDQGRRAISLVPDLHVVILHAEQVVQSVPEGLARLEPTRPLTMIAGPSATSDIELSRVEGVHGPRTLRVIIVR
jgi:L-lactate dehydrogenase complex protein LldG